MARRIGTIRTVKALRSRVRQWRAADEKIALVPTMGALHEGHLALIEAAAQKADRVIVSIFVNPTQFGPNEDLAAYPRDEKGDLAKASAAGADVAFLPNPTEIYPDGFATTIHVAGLTENYCGASRPGHFDGVATVVAKLFIEAAPDFAFFGEKDYQQLLMIKRMAKDLDLPLQVIGVPIVREADGLARSSRNAYLSPVEREIAPLLNRALNDMASDLLEDREIEDALAASQARLEQGGFQPDYLAVADAETLEPLTGFLDRPARILAAAFLGRTRLIDNVPVAPKPRRRARKA